MVSDQAKEAVKGLLTPDFQSFERLVFSLMSRDNEHRKFAEEVLEELQGHPDVCVQYLTKTLRESPVVENRSFCAVMVRKLLVTESPTMWSKLSSSVKEAVKTELLLGMQQETESEIGHKICDAISEIASLLESEGGWNDLLQCLFQFLGSANDTLIERSLYIIETLAVKDVLSLFKNNMMDVYQVLDLTLSNQNINVKKAAAMATCSVIQSLHDVSQENTFQPLLPKILGCLASFLNIHDYGAAEDVLESFIELAEKSPRIFRKHLSEIASSMMQIAQSDGVEEGVRILAAEFLLTLCEKKEKGMPRQLKKIPNFVYKMFEILMGFLLKVEDEEKWHTAEEGDESDAGHDELFEVGQECFDRLALAFTGEVLLPIAGPVLNNWIRDPDWKKRHACLMCLAQIAEGCVKVMLKELNVVSSICVSGLGDSHPKVRWAACQATGQLCTDLGPDIQNSHHSSLMPALINCMDDKENPRVQAHASSAIVNFTEICDKEDILPYMDSLMSKLFQQMMSNSKLVIESALTALSSVAECAKEQFEVYYRNVMPLLRQVFVQATDHKYHTLRAKALECISLVGMAVGRETFRNDAKDIMQMLGQLQNSQLDPDDPLQQYMLQAGVRLCKSLGQEFIPYLGIVMPYVMKKAGQEPDIEVSNLDDSEDEEEEEDEDDMERIVVGEKVLKIRSSVMEEKATACHMLVCYAEELKEGFLPYVKEATDIAVPLMKFYYNEEVREAAFQMLPGLLESATLAATKGTGVDFNYAKQMLDYIWPNLMEALESEVNLEMVSNCLASISAIVDLLNSDLLQPAMVEKCFGCLKDTAEKCEKRRKERLEENDDYDDAEEDEEGDLVDEAEEDIEILQGISTVLESFLKIFGDNIFNLMAQIIPIMLELVSRDRHPDERSAGFGMIDDLLLYSPMAAERYMSDFLHRLLEDAIHQDAGLRQVCCYGLGLISYKYPQKVEHLSQSILNQLLTVIQRHDARKDGSEDATDNAVSALGKFIIAFPKLVDTNIIQVFWLENLPLTSDMAEAKLMHLQLVEMVKDQDPRVLGDGNKNLPKIIQIFVQILGRGTKLAEADTLQEIIILLKHFQGSLGSDILQTAISELTPKQQLSFQKLTTESCS